MWPNSEFLIFNVLQHDQLGGAASAPQLSSTVGHAGASVSVAGALMGQGQGQGHHHQQHHHGVHPQQQQHGNQGLNFDLEPEGLKSQVEVKFEARAKCLYVCNFL